MQLMININPFTTRPRLVPYCLSTFLPCCFLYIPLQEIATVKTISMLKQVAEMCPKDNKTLYDVAVALYHFSGTLNTPFLPF